MTYDKQVTSPKNKTNQRLKLLTFPSLASITLAACGGGGGPIVQPPPANRDPVAEANKTLTIDEDATNQALSITTPTDPDGNNLTISVTAVPSGGTLATADGTAVTASSTLTLTQLTGLVFTPDANLNDDTTTFGTFTYTVSDGSLTDSSTITISVTPINDAPELVGIMEFAVDENTTAVADITATDVDGDTLTYSVTGGDDQALFAIDASTGALSFITRPDYENPGDSDQDNIYSVQVTVSDGNGGSVSQSYVITVNDVSTHVAITNTVIDENDAGAIIGTLSAAIDDINATHEYTYTLSGTDAGSFEVVDGQLKLKDGVTADYETKNSYSVTVTATDTGGLTTTQSFTVTINDINDAPTAINLTGSLYVNDNDTGAVVSALTTDDEDAGDSHTYSLSGTDASLFEIVDGKLKLKDNVTPVNAIQSTYSVTVTSTDKGGASINQTYTVEVNIAPTDLALDSYAVDENYVGSAVGTISTTDSNTNDEFTYSLSGTDAASFEVDSGQLMVKSGTWLDYETKSTYSVTITVTDQGGLTFDKIVTINVNDVDYGNPWVNEHVSVFDMPISDDIGIRGQQWVSSWADGSQQEMPFSIKFEHDNDPNTPLVITYSLMNTNSVLGDNYDNDTEGIVEPYYNIKDYSAEWEAAVDKAFEYWGNVSGITFIKVEDNANMCGDIRIALASGFGESFGWSNVPSYYQGENNSAANDIWIKSYYDQWDGSWPAYNHWFLIHEIGHSLGLAHPHDDYYSTVEQNTAVYTVMSYIGWAYIQNPWPGYEVGDELFIDQLGINDIKTIQYLYGMTPNFNNGNTVYTYTGPIYTTIYDTDGIDTIDVSSYTIDITLDLRGGMVSYIGTAEIELEIPYGNGSGEYNLEYSGFPLGIAENTIIENAKTGSGNDTITCNNVANTITCGAGNDSVYGAEGNDVLDGGTGTDTLTGGSGADIFVTRSGNGSANLADADIITDFEDGADLIGLDGLVFSQLTIEQGIDDYASHTVVSITATGEYLFIIQYIAAHSITAADFTTMNINFSSSASKVSNDHNTNNTPHIIGEEGALGSGENDFFDLGLRVEASDLSNLTLPETEAERSDLPAPDLSGLKDLVTDAAENLVMVFEPMTKNDAISASIESIKPIECKPISQLDLIIDTDWNPIQEELLYTSELGYL